MTKRNFGALSLFLLLIALNIHTPLLGQWQEEEPEFYEFTVFVNISKVGGAEIPALVHENYVLLSLADLFSFLKVKATFSSGFDTAEGFFVEESNSYLIEREKNSITYKGVVHKLNPGDLIRSETGLYLRGEQLGAIFGLECQYSFRSLTVTLKSSTELPVIKEMRVEQMRRNIKQLTGELEADSTIKASYPLFKFGMADWSLSSTQQIEGKTTTNVALRLGAAVMGGEFNLALQQNLDNKFDIKNQQYYWRWANNKMKGLRQINLGKLYTESTTNIGSSLLGGSFSNTPTTHRSSYGTYTLSDFTEPEWMVELYVNNVLVDYKKADASGFFSFEVPLVYGATAVRLQYYGPWGEIRSVEKYINIPYTLIPTGNFEYRITAGVLDDTTSRKFTRASFNYGLSNSVTIGGGAEYLSPATNHLQQFIPYLSASARIGGSILLSATYDHDVRVKGDLNYRLPSDIQLEASYTSYLHGQTAIRTSYTEERRLSISAPLSRKKFSLYSRLSLNNNVTLFSQFYSCDLMLTTVFLGVSSSLTTTAQKYGKNDLDIYSTLNLSMRLPGRFILSPSARYNYNRAELVSYGAKIEKLFGHRLYLGAGFEHHPNSNYSSIDFGLRYDFSFARFGFNARKSGGVYSLSENASGSIMVDPTNKYIGAGTRGAVSRGGVVVYPFLDINGNGIKESNEPRVQGVNVVTNSGLISYSERDTLIRISELEPYADYFITFDDIKLDNIAWKLKYRTMRIAADPNLYKKVYLPVMVLGEAGGMVYLTRGQATNGIGRIRINFFRASDSQLVYSVLTEDDGFFTKMGFAPGKYYASLDPEQLEKTNLSTNNMRIDFEIEACEDGDYVDDLEFNLFSAQPLENSTPEEPAKAPEKITIIEDSAVAQKQIPILESANETQKRYKVQLFALKNHNGVYEQLLPLLAANPNLVVQETLDRDSLYRYGAGEFNSYAEATKLLQKVKTMGWRDAYILSYIPYQEKIITTNLLQYVPERAQYMIQLCALKNKNSNPTLFTKVTEAIANSAIKESTGKDGLTRYTLCCFATRQQAIKALRAVRELGWKEAYIIVATE